MPPYYVDTSQALSNSSLTASTNTAINPLQNSGSPPPSSVEEVSKDHSELSDCGTQTTPSSTCAEGSPDTAQRDPRYWFDDGSVILLVQDVEFRVYKGILERHSSVLRAMFSLCSSAPQEAFSHTDPGAVEAKTLFPVVRLSDSARDWRHLFDWCMRGGTKLKSSREGHSGVPFERTSAYLRLGHKYQIKNLYTSMMNYLREYFDVTSVKIRTPGWPYVPNSFSARHAIGVVNIGRLTGETSLVPSALILCAGLEVSALAEGFCYSDGEVERLSEADFITCCRLKPILSRASLSILADSMPTAACARRCTDGRGGFPNGVSILARHLPAVIAECVKLPCGWPSMNVEDYSPWTTQVRQLCTLCRDGITNREKQAKTALWNDLLSAVATEDPMARDALL